MPSRPKKKPSNKKLKHNFIHHSLPTIQIKPSKRFAEANSDVKFCCEEKEEDLSSCCETASLTCHQDHQMADSSSNGNGKLEETEKVEEGDEAVKDVSIDDYSLEHAKEPAEESSEVVESEEKEEEEEGSVAIAVEEKEASLVEEEVKEEQYVTYVDETEEDSPVVEDELLEEVDEPVSVPVPVSTPVESADATEGYSEREIPATEEKPSIVSMTRAPLQPTSWSSCCGLFEALRRSDR